MAIALTMSIALSDPAKILGGRFLTYTPGMREPPTEHDMTVTHELQCGDAILFRSEDFHNVSPVTSGIRYSLVMEMWACGENKLDRNK